MKLECPYCTENIPYDDDRAGIQIACPWCKRSLLLPKVGDLPTELHEQYLQEKRAAEAKRKRAAGRERKREEARQQREEREAEKQAARKAQEQAQAEAEELRRDAARLLPTASGGGDLGADPSATRPASRRRFPFSPPKRVAGCGPDTWYVVVPATILSHMFLKDLWNATKPARGQWWASGEGPLDLAILIILGLLAAATLIRLFFVVRRSWHIYGAAEIEPCARCGGILCLRPAEEERPFCLRCAPNGHECMVGGCERLATTPAVHYYAEDYISLSAHLDLIFSEFRWGGESVSVALRR